MALAGLTQGRAAVPGKSLPPEKRLPAIEGTTRAGSRPRDRASARTCDARASLHNALMDRCGWPVPHDGQLLVSHQDALLMGGRAPPDIGPWSSLSNRETCGTKICIEMCSGQAITAGDKAVPAFDRDKCVHCGACLWNCAASHPDDPERSAIEFRGGTGGLHSAEN
jgi:electron-transferring-flavoprotein dehydrogenase